MKLGIIGSSEGNGHPFSWSAILNGYDRHSMRSCGFPAISEYLDKQSWPNDMISGSQVSHVWTQNQQLTEQISATCQIPNICLAATDMIGEIDGVLLARDDAKNHIKNAIPFLRAGLPIYIDKPVALSLRALSELYEEETFEGQIFSCSALRYSDDMSLSLVDKQDLGQLLTIRAQVPKDWEKYAIHAIEPILKILNSQDQIVSDDAEKISNSIGSVATKYKSIWSSGVSVQVLATGMPDTPITLTVEGSKQTKELVFSDVFFSFRKAIEEFIEGAENRTIKSPLALNKKVVSFLERGT